MLINGKLVTLMKTFSITRKADAVLIIMNSIKIYFKGN